MPPDARPQRGDVLLRGSTDTGYQLIDPVTQRQIVGGLLTLADVVAAARRHGANGIWQEAAKGRHPEDLKRLSWRMPNDD
jgi:hypothetical protein